MLAEPKALFELYPRPNGLLAPELFRTRNADAALFDVFIPHEEIALRCPAFALDDRDRPGNE